MKYFHEEIKEIADQLNHTLTLYEEGELSEAGVGVQIVDLYGEPLLNILYRILDHLVNNK